MRRQPFVYVFGRSFWAVSLYGANVYVEQVMPALEDQEAVTQVVTRVTQQHNSDEDRKDNLERRVTSPAPQDITVPRAGSPEGAGAASYSHHGVSSEGPVPACEAQAGCGCCSGQLADFLTGKFVLYVEEDADHNPRLALRVEVARGRGKGDAGLAGRVAASVRQVLLRLSSEYANYVPSDRQLPVVNLHAFGDPQWFPVGVKHRYTLG